jgi:hypothetical protein
MHTEPKDYQLIEAPEQNTCDPAVIKESTSPSSKADKMNKAA